MFSFLSIENCTDFPVISAKSGDGVIFSDIPRGERSATKRLCPGSVRLEIYDNFMRPVTLLWLPLPPGERAHLCIYPDAARFTPTGKREAF